MVIDRDLNAAINLRNYGLKQLRVVNPEVTPVDKKALAKENLCFSELSWMKQEFQSVQ